MKIKFTIFLLVILLLSIYSPYDQIFAQNEFEKIDTILANQNNSFQQNTAQSVQSVNITGHIKALIIPIGFSDKDGTKSWPTIANNTYFPKLGVDTNGTLLQDLISQNNNALPEDQWYQPAFDHYFKAESGGRFTVDFKFVKKPDGTLYEPNHPFSYFGNVAAHDAEIADEVAQNMYADDPAIFDNVHHLSLTFQGLTDTEFYVPHAPGYTRQKIYTLRGGSGQPDTLYSGPITFQIDAGAIGHEFMHSIGKAYDINSSFWGFPDRGSDKTFSDGSADLHGNMNASYDMMYHDAHFPALHSLYGLFPLTSYDLIFLGWITPSEILTINSTNFSDYSDIKLADVNDTLTQQQISEGYHRIIKVIVPNSGGNDYFLVEYHKASEFDKNFENYDEYQTGGYNTGVLIWHIKDIQSLGLFSDNLMELEPAVPYNSWHGDPIPNDNYPAHGNFSRPSLPQYNQVWWNGIYSGDFNYLDDNRAYENQYNETRNVFFPDGGRHVWETTLATMPGWTGFNSWEEPGTVNLFREQSMRSDFFSNNTVKGYVSNSMTDATRPSTKEWGQLQNNTPIAHKTHIAITNITTHSGYMSVRVYYNYWTGTYSSNQTMSGNAIIDGKMTVKSGATLTINPNTTIQFLNGASLTVNGTLHAAGTSDQKIIFTSQSNTTPGSWGSIEINGSGASGSYIKYADIKYGSQIDVISANNVAIQHCNIINSSGLGIEFSGGSGSYASYDTIANSNTAHGIVVQNGAHVTVNDNVIYKTNQNHQGVGIYFGGGGTGMVGQNDIEYYNWGICAIWGSSPTFQNADYNDKRVNRITNCSCGVMIYRNSYPVIGIPVEYFGINTIYDNNIDISLNKNDATNSSLYAYDVYWKYGDLKNAILQKNSGSTIYDNPPSTSDPWRNYLLPSMVKSSNTKGTSTNNLQKRMISGRSVNSQSLGANTIASNSLSSITNSDSLLIGLNLLAKKDHKAAKDLSKLYLKKHPDNQAAYSYLYDCADSSTIQDITNYFEKLPSKASKGNKLLLSYLYLKQGKVHLAKKVNDKIISGDPNTALSIRAMLNNFYIALYNEKDLKTAASLLNDIEKDKSLSTQMEIVTAEEDYKEYGGLLSSINKTALPQIKTAVLQKGPKSYSLSQNYPNPFNPSTTIHYEIPNNGIVTLKVYDILGKEVKTLVNQYQNKGRYDVNFNAKDLASGVYIYRLQSGSFVSTKKMLLLK